MSLSKIDLIFVILITQILSGFVVFYYIAF